MENSFDINKKILSYCTNYYKIMNIDFYEDDKTTEELLNIYTEFIFSVTSFAEEDVNLLKDIDSVIYKYMTDHKFKKELRKEFNSLKTKKNFNSLRSMVERIILIYENYTLNYTKNIFLPRWL